MGYHRILTHKSALLPVWFERIIVLLGLPAGTPIQWVGSHRAHHGFADQEGDPHSPHTMGFWFAHCGWYIGSTNIILCFLYAIGGPCRMIFDAFWRPRTNQQHNYLAEDIAADHFYKTISQPCVYQLIILCYATAIMASGMLLFGLSGIVIIWVMLIVVYNLGDAVDSFGHLYGKKAKHSEARNNIVLGWLSFGDGWHANHHNNPTLAKHGINKWQFDLTFVILNVLKGIGLVKKIEENESK